MSGGSLDLVHVFEMYMYKRFKTSFSYTFKEIKEKSEMVYTKSKARQKQAGLFHVNFAKKTRIVEAFHEPLDQDYVSYHVEGARILKLGCL